MSDLRSFMLDRFGTDSASDLKARRTIVFHSESHICTVNGGQEHRVEPFDEATPDDAWWCDVLRDLGAQFREHPGYRKHWRPFAEWSATDWDDEENRVS